MAFRLSFNPVLIAIVVAGTVSSATVSSAFGQAVDRKAILAQQRQQYRQGVAQYPLMKQHSVDDVFHLRMSGNSLTVESPIEPDHDSTQHRADLAGFSEPAVIICKFISQDLGQVQIEINVDDYSDPLCFGRLHLQARPNGTETGKELEDVEIEKTWQNPTGFRRVFFTQVSTEVRMNVYCNDGPAVVNFTVVAKDFATMRRTHAAETERWLRPVLHELHQEAAFAAEPTAAWQVLAPDWPIDLHLKPAIDERIPLLDSDDFRVRLRGADELERLGRDGRP